MTIPELKAKIETLDDVAKVLSDLRDHDDLVDLYKANEEIEHMRGRLTSEKRRLEKASTPASRTETTAARTANPANIRQLHADAETVVGRS